jgi:hypothetical protein
MASFSNYINGKNLEDEFSFTNYAFSQKLNEANNNEKEAKTNG